MTSDTGLKMSTSHNMNGLDIFAIFHHLSSLSQPTYYAAALTGLAEEKLTSTPQINQNLPAPQSALAGLA